MEGESTGRVFPIVLDTQTIIPAQVVVTGVAVIVSLGGFLVSLPRAGLAARRLPDEPAPAGTPYRREGETSWRLATSSRDIVQLSVSPPAEGWLSVGVAGQAVIVADVAVSVEGADELVELIGSPC